MSLTHGHPDLALPLSRLISVVSHAERWYAWRSILLCLLQLLRRCAEHPGGEITVWKLLANRIE